MKKIILLISALLLFTACSHTEPTKEDPVAEDESEFTNATLNDKGDFYSYEANYPVFKGMDEVNLAIKQIVNTELNIFNQQVEDMGDLSEFEDELIGSESTYGMGYEIYLLNENYVSFAFENYVYSAGAAHGLPYTIGFNYDLKNNKQIELSDLFMTDADFIKAISENSIPKIQEVLSIDDYDLDEWILEGAGPDPANYHTFTITEDSLVVHFDVYQVAPFAAGPQKIMINFDEVSELLVAPWSEMR